MTRVLIVEDDPDLGFGLQTTLEIEGYTADVAADGLQGLQRARDDRPDLIILDLMLPGMDGYRVLRTLRAEGNRVPVLILTARGEEADKVLGFRSGADDYVTKPFGLLELLARVEALLRRAGGGVAQAPAIDRFGEVEMDRAARTITRRGEAVQLAPREFDLLVALYDRGGGVISRHDLLREVWGHRGAILTRTVDIHVAELRRKLEDDPAEPRHILTVWKKGYRLKR
jgi:two-component system alkaline phosphatase synthesis response regulator PhoP